MSQGGPPATPPAGAAGDAAGVDAGDLTRRYVAEYYTFSPHRGVWDGRHEYDGLVSDVSPAGVAARVTALERWAEPLRVARAAANDAARASHPREPPLTTPAARDLALVEYFRRLELFALRDWQPQTFLPVFYYAMFDLSMYIKRPYASAGERLDALTRHLRALPDLLEGGCASLRGPFARTQLHQGISLFEGVAGYYTRDLAGAARSLAATGAQWDTFAAALGAAVTALERLVRYLRERAELRPGRDPVLGGDLFQRVIQHLELVDLPLDRLRAMAEDELAALRARADELAGRLGITTTWAFGALSRKRPAEDQVLADAGRAIEEVRGFLRASGVVEIPDDVGYVLDRTPSFLHGGSAFAEVPGPYERPGLPALIYVTLPDPQWPAEQRRTWLNKLNPWGLRNTAAHEAFPGHVLHGRHLARNPSEAARTFTSFAHVEGWAHYGELLLIEQGFGGGDPRFELAYLAMALLRVCRLLVALDLNRHALTPHEAAEFIRRTTHFPPIRCRPEVTRAAQDPRVIGYTLGKLLLLQLRADYARQEGQAYSLRRFHDALLACGAPPLPLARQMLLREPGPDPLSPT